MIGVRGKVTLHWLDTCSAPFQALSSGIVSVELNTWWATVDCLPTTLLTKLIIFTLTWTLELDYRTGMYRGILFVLLSDCTVHKGRQDPRGNEVLFLHT